MKENWEKSQEILQDAEKRSKKCRKEIESLLQQELTQKNYKKIRKLLDKDSDICNKAIDKAQKIRQKEINKESDEKES